MRKWWNDLWLWSGWLVVKWFFGVFILWLVLSQIWNVSAIQDYDKKVVKDTKYIFNEVKDFSALLVQSISNQSP